MLISITYMYLSQGTGWGLGGRWGSRGGWGMDVMGWGGGWGRVKGGDWMDGGQGRGGVGWQTKQKMNAVSHCRISRSALRATLMKKHLQHINWRVKKSAYVVICRGFLINHRLSGSQISFSISNKLNIVVHNFRWLRLQ